MPNPAASAPAISNPFRDPAPASRHGKIARLPAHIRDQVNRRLDDNQPAHLLLQWLNALPETQAMLRLHFDASPISPQNLSEWRQGGFRQWLLLQQLLDHAAILRQTASQIEQNGSLESLADNLANALALRYAALLNDWDGQPTPEFEARLRLLSVLTRDLTQLQKALHAAAQRRRAVAREDKEAQRQELEDARAAALKKLKIPNRISSLEACPGIPGPALAAVEAAQSTAEIHEILAKSNSIKPSDLAPAPALNPNPAPLAESDSIKLPAPNPTPALTLNLPPNPVPQPASPAPSDPIKVDQTKLTQ